MASFFIACLLDERERRDREIREYSDVNRRAVRRRKVFPMDITEEEFIRRYRLSKMAFKNICQEIRSKTNLKENRISIELKVICALSYYATGSYQRIVYMGRYFGPITVNKFTMEITEALNNPGITNDLIRFPSTRAERDVVKQKFFNKYRIPGVCGAIDGSLFRVNTLNKDIHLFNAQIVCDTESLILNVDIKYGATRDVAVWENSLVNKHMQALHRNNEHAWLIGDSAYPQKPWLMTPIQHPVNGSLEDKYTLLHGKAILAIKNTIGKLRNRWRCLNKDLNYPPENSSKIVIACCVLHNLAIRFGVPDHDCGDVTGDIDSTLTSDFKIDLNGLAMRRTLVDLISSF